MIVKNNLYLQYYKKIMSISFIIGWMFTLATWIPKPFIKDERKRTGTNLALAGIGLGIFIADFIHLITK
jgi:hypothetical protein